MTEVDSTEMRLQENLAAVRQKIADAAEKSGRNADDITLVAVTKYVDESVTRSLIRCGQIVLGESRPQALWEKAQALSGETVQWHMIGHLQRNKVKRTIPYCTLIHSIDSIRLLESVDAHSAEQNAVANCLLEINVSGEAAKHGFATDQIEATLVAAAQMTSVRISGFMAMASLAGDAETNRAEFARLRELRDEHNSFTADNIALTELSMGMSRDFESAIEEGATIVRIGSVLFEGLRD